MVLGLRILCSEGNVQGLLKAGALEVCNHKKGTCPILHRRYPEDLGAQKVETAPASKKICRGPELCRSLKTCVRCRDSVQGHISAMGGSISARGGVV